MARKAKVDYDKENDILWVYSGEKVRDSLEIDSFIIDFSHDDKVVGVEILDASEVISNLALSRISREMLSNIKETSLSIYQSRELFYVVVGIVLEVDNKLREIPIQVPAPKVAVAVQG
ncbi:MAG: DUF2283 domain-containing protein [Candidatus Aenigmarchaeota archaeon]|nr:DUF2283 domain-containing protein [Candidatus Aenigmarchaeota archaeon]